MIPELTRRLRDAAPSVRFPPTPDLAGAVLERIPAQPRRSRPLRRAALTLACVAAVSATALATSQRARSALVDVLDVVPGVEISRSPQLPARMPLLASSAEFGRLVSLDEARRRAGFELRLPANVGRLDAVYLDEGKGGAAVTALYGREHGRAALVITQWHPSTLLFRKLLGSWGARVRAVEVDRGPGLWLRGDHEVFYLGRDRRPRRGAPFLAGSALVWHRERVTYRLEGDLTLGQALALARSLE